MKDAAMLVVPSECYEGFPRVVVEAFATGTPMVAADIGGLGELVNEGVEGLKFRPGPRKGLQTQRRASGMRRSCVRSCARRVALASSASMRPAWQ